VARGSGDRRPYADSVVRLDGRTLETIDVVNAKSSRAVVLDADGDLGSYRVTVRDCQGRVVRSDRVRLSQGLTRFDVPVSGLLTLER
jgi:hypothetical protein